MPINSIQSNSTFTSQNSNQTSAVNNNSEASKPLSTEKTEDARSETSISSRAENLQKLSKEFFPGGPRTIKITPAFIQRLQEYGFISNQDAEKLNSSLKQWGLEANATSNPEKELPQSVEQLESFANTLTARLEKEAPTSGLIKLLNAAKSAMENIDSSSPTNALDYKSLSSQLNEAIKTDESTELSTAEKRGISILSATFSLMDKLGPAQSSSKEINKYLSILA